VPDDRDDHRRADLDWRGLLSNTSNMAPSSRRQRSTRLNAGRYTAGLPRYLRCLLKRKCRAVGNQQQRRENTEVFTGELQLCRKGDVAFRRISKR
jgi:hypothetical protein